MICLFFKLRIKRIALRDANGLYGNFLVFRQEKSEEIPAINIDFQSSNWMRSLVSDFTNTVDKFINERKDINVLYHKIKQCYSKFIEANNELKDKKLATSSRVSDIEAEIVEVETRIIEIAQLLSDFHDGKPLPNGLTPHKLNSSKAELEQKRFQKQAQKESVSDITSIQTVHDKLIKDYRDEVRQLEYDYSRKIDYLYKKIHRRENKYDKQIIYYWENLCEYIQNIYLKSNNQKPASESIASYSKIFQIAEPVKLLRDIAPFCGKNLPTKEDLFKNERTFINTIINQSMGIQYEV